jgi:hypothetical protein
MEDLINIVKSLVKDVRLLWATIGILFAGLIGLVAIVVVIYVRQDRQGTTSCNIQARGLKATPHLVNAMGDIGELLGGEFKSLTPAQKKHIPAKTFKLVYGLQSDSTAYARIEGHQPKSRSC